MATHPVLLPGESHGWRNLAGYSPWGHKESHMTERLHFLSLLDCRFFLVNVGIELINTATFVLGVKQLDTVH